MCQKQGATASLGPLLLSADILFFFHSKTFQMEEAMADDRFWHKHLIRFQSPLHSIALDCGCSLMGIQSKQTKNADT